MKQLKLLALLTCISLTACEQSAESPKQVAEQYWQALKSGDIASAKKLVSNNTQTDLENYLALPGEEKIALDEINLGEEYATVTTIIASKTDIGTSQAQTPNTDHHISFDTVLILEQGKWKIDASRTQVPAPQKPEEQSSDALQENLNSMDEVLEQGADMLNEFLQEGSKEMSESLLKGMNKMNESLREALEKMKQRRQMEEKSPPTTEDKNGEGLI